MTRMMSVMDQVIYWARRRLRPSEAIYRDVGGRRPALQAFAGSLEGQRAYEGRAIMYSRFSSEAEDYVKRISKRFVFLDGKTLARLMYE